MEKYEKPVTIVPCGFNYYDREQFRSQVIMDFGPRYEIPKELVDIYKEDKRKAVEILL